MQEHSILAHFTLGYGPLIDAQRQVAATRLTLFAGDPAPTPDAAALLAALRAVWPEPGAAPARPPVLLNVAHEAWLRALLAAAPGPSWALEVPAFAAADAGWQPLLAAAHAAGTPLLLKGRAAAALAPEVAALFGQTIAELDAVAGARLPAQTLVEGVHSSAQVAQALAQGAAGVLGWPLDDPPPVAGKGRLPTDVSTVMALIQGVDRGDDVRELEAVLKRDPGLAFRLMRYLNSPAFGLSVEVNSLGHALMLLGYNRLKRWLALLLASAGQAEDAKPLMFAAVRRGLLAEALGRIHGDAETQGELFLCGVFSLLDRLLQQPLDEVLKGVPVPERVAQALRDESGPHGPYLALVRAVEQSARFDIAEQRDALLVSAPQLAQAVLAALQAGRQLEA